MNAKNSLWDTPLHAACENQRVNTFVEKRVHFTLTFYPDENNDKNNCCCVAQ